MITVLALAAAMADEPITIQTKPVKTIQTFKSEFKLGPGSKTSPIYFNCKFPTNSPLPIPVTVKFKSYPKNSSTPASKLEEMLLVVNSTLSDVYNSYNLQRIEDSPFGFKCSVKNGVADFSLEREGGAYENRGTIEATVMLMPEKVNRTAYSGDLNTYQETYSLARAGDYPVAASISRKVGPTVVFIPTWLTVTAGGKTLYHQQSGDHRLVLHIEKALPKAVPVEIKLYTKVTSPEQKPKVAILCMPTLPPPTFR